MKINLLRLYVRLRLAIDPAYRRQRAEYADQYRVGWMCHRAGLPPGVCGFTKGLRAGYEASQKTAAQPYTIAGVRANTV